MDFVREGIRLDFSIGPFQDSNGTPITNLDSTTLQNNSSLVVNLPTGGATVGAPSVGSSMVHISYGYYRVYIPSGDWSSGGWTPGERLSLIFDSATIGCLPMWKEWKIISNNGYGSIFQQDQLTNTLNVDVKKLNGVDQDAQNLYPDVLATKNNVGSPTSLGGTTDISGMLRSIADNNSGADFDSSTDSLHELTGTIVEAVPVNVTADGQTLTNGTVITGDYTSTFTNDGAYFQLEPNGAALDVELLYTLGLDDTPSTLSINGYVETIPGTNFVNIFAWNYTTSQFDQLSDSLTRMNEETGDQDYTYTLLPAHKNSVDGKMRIRFLSDSTTAGDDLFLDAVLVKSVSAGSTPAEIAQATFNILAPYTVYQDGIYIDTINGQAGVDIGVNGIQGNPVDNIADAFTIANTVGVRIFTVNTGSTLVLDRNVERWLFKGLNADIDLNGFDVDGCQFFSFAVTGIATSASGRPLFKECAMEDVTLPACVLLQCGIIGPVTFSTPNGFYLIDHCSSAVPGAAATPIFIMSQDGIMLNIRHWSGGIEFQNMQTNVVSSVEGWGQVILNANCTGGNIAIRGDFNLTNDTAGAVIINDKARYTIEQVRKSMELAEQGTPVATSIDAKLDSIQNDTSEIGTIGETTVDTNNKVTNIEPVVNDTNVKVTNIENSDFLSLNDTVDGVTISRIFEYIMSMASGRFLFNSETGEMIMYKRDNTTPLLTLKLDGEDRERISG